MILLDFGVVVVDDVVDLDADDELLLVPLPPPLFFLLPANDDVELLLLFMDNDDELSLFENDDDAPSPTPKLPDNIRSNANSTLYALFFNVFDNTSSDMCDIPMPLTKSLNVESLFKKDGAAAFLFFFFLALLNVIVFQYITHRYSLYAEQKRIDDGVRLRWREI